MDWSTKQSEELTKHVEEHKKQNEERTKHPSPQTHHVPCPIYLKNHNNRFVQQRGNITNVF